MNKRNKSNSRQTKTVDTLILTGNGFDIWQGLQTDYGEFEKYYLANRDAILEKLGLTKHWHIIEDDGTEELFGDVEMIYGDAFDPQELEHGFWHTFEFSLGQLDSQRINAFFGKEDDDLVDLSIAIDNAQAVLSEAFSGWISTIEADERVSDYQFGDNCLFVNFNYTDTLEKRMGISHDKVFYIHGKANEKENIIFGHSMHPQLPVDELYNLGGRFRGLYFVESLLYETDKHAYLHYLEFLIYLASNGISLSDIKTIYVLGHSFASADFEYFQELSIATGAKRNAFNSKDLPSLNSFEALHLMIGYIILTYGGDDGPHPEIDASRARAFGQLVYQLQKKETWKSIKRQYNRSLSNRLKYPNRLSDLSNVVAAPQNMPQVKWNVTYHSPEDKRHIEEVLRTTGIREYEMFDTIDACIAAFQKH